MEKFKPFIFYIIAILAFSALVYDSYSFITDYNFHAIDGSTSDKVLKLIGRVMPIFIFAYVSSKSLRYGIKLQKILKDS